MTPDNIEGLTVPRELVTHILANPVAVREPEPAVAELPEAA